MGDAVHSVIPKLRVSPLALPPRALCIDLAMAGDHYEESVTEKRPLSICLYSTEEEKRAGTTLATELRGPKSGVHLTRQPQLLAA